MIEEVLKQATIVTTTVTALQTIPIDLALAASLLIASAAIMALIFSALQIRFMAQQIRFTAQQIHESRKEREQRAYRELVMTPQFLKLFSALDMVREAMRAISTTQRGESGSLMILGEMIEVKDKKEYEQAISRIRQKLVSSLTEGPESLAQSGIKDLIPKKISVMLMDVVSSAADSIAHKRQFDAVDKKFDEMYLEIRKMLGVEPSE